MLTPNHSFGICGDPGALTSAIIFKRCHTKQPRDDRNLYFLKHILGYCSVQGEGRPGLNQLIFSTKTKQVFYWEHAFAWYLYV